MTRTLNLLGLLSSEPDPVGKWHVHQTNLPPPLSSIWQQKASHFLQLPARRKLCYNERMWKSVRFEHHEDER